MTEIENIFVSKIPANILLSIYNSDNIGEKTYSSLIAKKIDVTYSHCVKLLKVFKTEGLVDFEKIGRNKNISLTKIGTEVAIKLSDLRSLIKNKKSLNLNTTLILNNKNYTEEQK